MSVPPYYAHTHPDHPNDPEKWELLEVHLGEVAELTERYAAVFGAAEWGRLAGQWHDLGKFSREFQRKLHGEHFQVEHTGSGAALAKELAGDYWETLAFVIAGHHTGLSNRVSQEEGKLTPLDDRVKRASVQLTECKASVATLSPKEAAQILPDQVTLVVPEWISRADEEAKASWGCFVRMLFSALVDADSIATERFCSSGEKSTQFRAQPVYEDVGVLQARLDREIDRLAEKAGSSRVNTERGRILHWCREAAQQAPGFFTLNVPTGGGKTLEDRRSALDFHQPHNPSAEIFFLF